MKGLCYTELFEDFWVPGSFAVLHFVPRILVCNISYKMLSYCSE